MDGKIVGDVTLHQQLGGWKRHVGRVSVLVLPQLNQCPQCAAPYVPHRVCPACGYYKGRQVLSVTAGA